MVALRLLGETESESVYGDFDLVVGGAHPRQLQMAVIVVAAV